MNCAGFQHEPGQDFSVRTQGTAWDIRENASIKKAQNGLSRSALLL
jgi:hypothetical protein